MEIRLAVPCILSSLPEVHIVLGAGRRTLYDSVANAPSSSCAMHLDQAHRDASQQSSGPTRFLTLPYSTYPRHSASPQLSPHANICEGDLCRQPFHMSLLQLPLGTGLPDSPVTGAVTA